MSIEEMSRVDDGPASQYKQCDACGALLDRSQRYCVVCGAHQRHVHDPAAQYLAKVTAARPRQTTPTDGRRRSSRSPGLGTALVLAIIPLAVGLGVLVGRASNSGDAKLIAALRAQKPEVITSAGAGSAAAGPVASASTSVPAAALSSDFPLQSGYTIELQTVPSSGGQAAVNGAEHAARAKGASKVGVIVQSDFQITPAPPSGTVVIYSGAYSSKPAADAALPGLHKRFPGAKVIRVRPVGSSVAGAGKVLAKTPYGTAHQIAGFKPSSSQLAQGAAVVSKVQQQIGKSYVHSQRGLPDVISVP